MVDITQNLVIDGVNDVTILGTTYDWTGFPPFLAAYDSEATTGTTTLNYTISGDLFAYGLEVNGAANRDIVTNFTDVDDGFTRFFGHVRLFEGDHTINLASTGFETL